MTDEIAQPGCYLDGARGHYITRDMIQLAEGMGFLPDPFAAYALSRYDDESHDDDYPHEALRDLSDEVLDWLNADPQPFDGRKRTGPLEGQHNPPAIPAGHSWQWFDGDFGLYADEEGDD